MAIEWTEASSELIHRAEKLIARNQPDLEDAVIGFAFQKGEGSEIKGHAAKVTSASTALMDYQFVIWINEEFYNKITEPLKNALVDHELYHCTMDDNNEPKVRKHDIEEFNNVIRDYGFILHLDTNTVVKSLSQPKLDGIFPPRHGKAKAIEIGGQVLEEVAKQVNEGALGKDVTAEVHHARHA